MKKILIYVLISILFLLLTLSSCKSASNIQSSSNISPSLSTSPSEPSPTMKPTPQQTKIALSFAGDCVLGNINEENNPLYFPSIYESQDSYTYPFDLVKGIFENDDLTIVNCEGTFTDSTVQGKKKWRFRGPKEYSGIFAASSIEAVSICNNHVPYDYLSKGYEDTKQNLTDAGTSIFYTETPYIIEIKGTQVVVIGDDSTSMGTTGIKERVLSEIKKYKRDDNLVIVDMHWGSEYQELPTQWQQEAGHAFIDSGADLVVGQHPHILQGIELYNNKYIVYSLGNFAFGGNEECKYPETFIFTISFNTTDNSSEASIVPCFMTSTRDRNSSGIMKNNYQPMPVEGSEAEQVKELILKRSAPLKYGIDSIDTYVQK